MHLFARSPWVLVVYECLSQLERLPLQPPNTLLFNTACSYSHSHSCSCSHSCSHSYSCSYSCSLVFAFSSFRLIPISLTSPCCPRQLKRVIYPRCSLQQGHITLLSLIFSSVSVRSSAPSRSGRKAAACRQHRQAIPCGTTHPPTD